MALFALALQQTEGNLIMPLLMGSAAEMHLLSITVGVLLFGSVLGLVGAFLIVIKAVYEIFSLDRQPDVPQQPTRDLIHGELAEASPEGKGETGRGTPRPQLWYERGGGLISSLGSEEPSFSQLTSTHEPATTR